MRDGLQPERTELAWHRTALAAAACTLLLLHIAAQRGWPLDTVVPLTLAAASTVVIASGNRIALVGIMITATCGSAVPLVLLGP